MEHATAEPAESPSERDDLPGFVDWLVGALYALFGLALLVGGTAITTIVDRAWIVSAVEEGTMQSSLFTEAELIEIATSLVTWLGWGLLVTGALLVVGGIAYAYLRYRAGKRYAQDPAARNDYWANAIRGALVSGLLAFVPFSTAIGGAVAGYLEHRESDRTVSVGAVSGLIQMAPFMLLVLFVLGGVVAGSFAIQAPGIAFTLVLVMFFVLLIMATIGAGIGAAGGYVGGKLAGDRSP